MVLVAVPTSSNEDERRRALLDHLNELEEADPTPDRSKGRAARRVETIREAAGDRVDALVAASEVRPPANPARRLTSTTRRQLPQVRIRTLGTMHCPFCGALGDMRDGVFVCGATAVDLSPRATGELTQIAERQPEVDPAPAGTRWGVRWHCPSDGERLVNRGAHVRCDLCGHQLIRSSWHPPVA